MKIIARTILVMLTIASLCGIALDTAFASGSWTGVYRVEGANPDGSTYTGAAEIRPVADTEFYQVAWVIDTEPGEIAMVAFGFVYEDRLVLNGLQAPMPVVIKSNGDVRWAIPGTKTPGREKFTRTNFKTLPEAVRPVPTRRAPVANRNQREA